MFFFLSRSSTMKQYLLICYLLIISIDYSSMTLMDGIVTISWTGNENSPLIDRFLTNNSRIQLKILCRERNKNSSVTREQIKDTTVQIRGRIGRVVGCLPLQSNAFTTVSSKEKNLLQGYYDRLWKEMEQRTFIASQTDCDNTGTHLNIDQYSEIKNPEIIPTGYIPPKKIEEEKLSASLETLITWADGYYIIEISSPEVNSKSANNPMVNVILSIRNKHGGYLTADEYPALVFYAVMCGVYALFAILWFIWCFLYWRELLKIQFYIGGVILIGMIEKSAFIAEYDTLNKNGLKVFYAIVFAEILSCLKRAVSRMLVIIVVLGYGLVKPRLGSLKDKIISLGSLYFLAAIIESLARLNSKNDDTNHRMLLSRIPLALVDAVFYYWMFVGLVKTTQQLRLKKNLVKLNVYRHVTNALLFAIIASSFFMIWSLKSHIFNSCVMNWREFWINDAFWHVLFSIILFVIMFLFRPSKNNQRYAIVPLLDRMDNDDEDFIDDRTESIVFDSILMRKASTMESIKTKNQQENIEDALTWVEDNIPTSIADQALQVLDADDEDIVNTKLQRSKMQ